MAEDSSSAGESGYQMENALGDTLETERRGCGIAKEDFSLAKNFALPGEGRKLQIGANAGNAFNRHTGWFLNGAVVRLDSGLSAGYRRVELFRFTRTCSSESHTIGFHQLGTHTYEATCRARSS
jgi:hypothetical protein